MRSRRSRVTVITLLLGLIGLRGSALAASSQTVTLTPTVGPPTSKVTVAGTGFGASEAVDIAFDSSPLAVAQTDPSGAFSKVVTVPSSALPGTHTVAAQGETSGLTGQAPFLVRTDWPKWRYNQSNNGLNPYENVLSPSTVSNLHLVWSQPTVDEVTGSATVVGGVLYIGSWDHHVYAFDANTGSPIWVAPTG